MKFKTYFHNIVRMTACLGSTLSLIIMASPTAAHELWLAPIEYKPSRSSPIITEIRNGENFNGERLPFMPDRMHRLSVIDRRGERRIVADIGDTLLSDRRPQQIGLHILVYESHQNKLRHNTFDEFSDFVREEGHDWVIQQHTKRGLPLGPVTESYSRFAKSLVSVEKHIGVDRALGLELELIAQQNPYALKTGEGIRFCLLYHGEPLTDTQVTVFHRANSGRYFNSNADSVSNSHDELRKTIYRSDTEGMITLANPGTGSYLLNAVHLRIPTSSWDSPTSMWESLWASMTFEIE